jgi:hypothetical protein
LELLEQIVSIVSGIVGLGAGIAVFRGRPRPPVQLPAGGGTKLTSYRDDSALAKPRQPKHLRTFFLVGAFALLVPAPFAVLSTGPVGLFWLAGSAIYFLGAYWAGRERSVTFKSASLTVESPLDEVLARSHDAVTRLGLRVTLFDPAEGVIRARRRANLLTSGELVSIHVCEEDETHTRVAVESDLVWTNIFLDYGANQRNIDRIVAMLLRR